MAFGRVFRHVGLRCFTSGHIIGRNEATRNGGSPHNASSPPANEETRQSSARGLFIYGGRKGGRILRRVGDRSIAPAREASMTAIPRAASAAPFDQYAISSRALRGRRARLAENAHIHSDPGGGGGKVAAPSKSAFLESRQSPRPIARHRESARQAKEDIVKKSFFLTCLSLAAALTMLAMPSPGARAEMLSDVEAARANARAGGGTSGHDRDVLARHGALSGTQKVRSRSSRFSSSRTSTHRSRKTRTESASRGSGSGKSRKSSQFVAEKNRSRPSGVAEKNRSRPSDVAEKDSARPPDSDRTESVTRGQHLEIAEDPCDGASGNAPSACTEVADDVPSANPTQPGPEAAESAVANTPAAATGQPETLVRSLSSTPSGR